MCLLHTHYIAHSHIPNAPNLIVCQSRLLRAGRASSLGLGGGGAVGGSVSGNRRALLLGGDGGGRRHKYDYAAPPFKKLMAAVRCGSGRCRVSGEVEMRAVF